MARPEPTQQEKLAALLRGDFASFIAKSFNTVSPGKTFLPNWHVRAIAHQLERVRRGEVKRLIITMPPRMLKSISASVAFPAFLLGHDPTTRIVAVSYAEELAEKLARDSRMVMESEWYRDLFPATRLSRSKSAGLDYETTRRGGRLSTSVGGALTGRGGSIIVVDDPQKPLDAMSRIKRANTIEWFRNTISSRLDDKRVGAIIIVMQRLHVEDLAGHLLEQGGWTHLNLPAIATRDDEIETGRGTVHRRRAGEPLHATLEPLTVLEGIKADMGSAIFSAQYQQAPVPEDGGPVKPHWFGSYIGEPPAAPPGQIIQSWDLAVKDGERNDYTVCITAHAKGNAIHVLDVYRARLDYPSQRKEVIAQARKFKADVLLIEDAASGSPLVADLRHLKEPGVPTPIPIKARGSKEERLTVQSSRIEAGDVLLPPLAPWRDDFLTEFKAFPGGHHDDQVDALSQLLDWLGRRDRYRDDGPTFGPKIIRV